MKKLIVFLTTFVLAGTMMAQTIEVEDAQNRALQFLQGQSQTRASQQEVQLKLAYTSKSGDEIYYYVFNNANGGYVIMGGDEAAREVLGYGETGSFDYERIPDNMRWWLSQYDAQISQAIREVKAGTNKVVRQTQTRAERADIPVMLTTKWGQNVPYNMQLPTSQSGEANFPVGCAVTALAQIMNYHHWPDTGVGSNTLPEEYFGHKFTADFENTHYDWEAMADSYDTIYSGTREEVAVGTLMVHLGVAFNSSYDDGGTETDGYLAGKALANNFRYNKGMSVLFRFSYIDTDWEDIVYNELSANRPVFYGGHTKNRDGHSFVCDGYKEGLWHINWGWDGMYNNYYLITPTSTEKALQPGGTGTGGGDENASYATDQYIFKDLYPDTNNNTQYKKSVYCNIQSLNKKSFARGDSVTMNIYYQNLGVNEDTFEIRYQLVNVDDANDSYQIDDIYLYSLPVSQYLLFESSYCVPDGVRQGDTYQIIPFYKDENGEWKQVVKKLLLDFPPIRIGNKVELTKQPYVSNRRNACKDVFNVSFTIRNFTDSTLTFPMVINIYPEDEDTEPVDYFDLCGIAFAPREEKEILLKAEDLHYGDRMVVGKNYKLQLIDCTNDTLIGSPVTFSYLETLTIDITVPEMGWTTFAIPFNSEIPEGLKAYRVDIDYEEDDSQSIVLEKQDDFIMNCAYLIHGAPGTYQVVGPALELDDYAYFGYLRRKGGYVSEELCEYYSVLDQRDGIVGFYKMHEATRIGKYEAFLGTSSSEEMIPFNDPDEDDPTSLNQIITHDTPFDSRIYDLNGRIINTDHKGIVIRGGKVYIIK